MFWGIVLEPGVKYKTSVEKATRISNAALAYKSPDDKAAVKVHYAGMEFILCHLDGKNTRNTIIDVAFEKGEEIVLVSDGSVSVHLTGLTEEEEDDDSIMFDSDEEEAAMQPISKKRKGSEVSPKESPANAKRSRKAEMNKSTTEDDEDEDEDDSDFAFGDESDEDDDELGEEEDDLESFDEDAEMDDEDDLDDDDEEEEEKPTPLKKDKKGAQPKLAEKNKQQKKQQTASPADQKKPAEAAVNGTEQEGKKKKKKKNKKNKENKEVAVDTQKATPSPAKGTPGKEPATKTENKKGVVVTTLMAGTGPVAKNGKTVHVYYRGRLKSNNKEFDKVVDGKGFAFRLGGGEVIKGWDIGVEGMKVGEKRRLVVPANHAYGPKGVKPDIPPNATLIFDVELKAMS